MAQPTSYRERIQGSVLEEVLDALPGALIALPAFGILVSVLCENVGEYFGLNPMRVFQAFAILYFGLPPLLIAWDWLKRESYMKLPSIRARMRGAVALLILTVLWTMLSRADEPVIAIIVVSVFAGTMLLLFWPLADRTALNDEESVLTFAFATIAGVSTAGTATFALPWTETLYVAGAAALVFPILGAIKWGRSFSWMGFRTQPRPTFALWLVALLVVAGSAVWVVKVATRSEGVALESHYDNARQSALRIRQGRKSISERKRDERVAGEALLLDRMDSVADRNGGWYRFAVAKDSLRIGQRPDTPSMAPMHDATYRFYVDRLGLHERFLRDEFDRSKVESYPLIAHVRRVGLYVFGISLICLLLLRSTLMSAPIEKGKEGPSNGELLKHERRRQLVDSWIVVLAIFIMPLFKDINLDEVDPLRPYWALSLGNWYLPQFVTDVAERTISRGEEEKTPDGPVVTVYGDTLLYHYGDSIYAAEGKVTVIHDSTTPHPGPPDTVFVQVPRDSAIVQAIDSLNQSLRVRFYPRPMLRAR